MAQSNDTVTEQIYRLAIDDIGRSCRDIPESACAHQPKNFTRHVASLSLSKIADGLIDPKLVLSWLLTHLGASSTLIGLLVPIREAGALLPQLFTAGALRQLPQRKWAWAGGAVVQGLMALAMVLIALFGPDDSAPLLILIALAVLALARSVCSVCYKDVLGKTVAKSARGSATGLASSIAGGAIILFALCLIFGPFERFVLVMGALSIAALAFLSAALTFSTLSEEKGSTEGGRSAIRDTFSSLSYLKSDPQLRLFIAVRGLLTATALAPPFIVAAASEDGVLQTLGFFVLASAVASLLSGWVWGRFSDRSSRKVLISTGIISGVILAACTAIIVTGVIAPQIALPVGLFGLMLAYQGVRLGRSTHLVDMATEDTRAAYTALSNTIIGVLLLAGSGFGVLADVTNLAVVLGLMAAMCGLAALFAIKLDEVQAD